MALTDTAIRNLKPDNRPYKKSDDRGLYLTIMPEGSKLWRLAYRFAGKQKTLAFGNYPVVTLALAREKRDQAKRLLAQGIDPSEQRKADKRATAAARTFGEVADEWLATKREAEDKSESTLKRDRWLVRDWKLQIGGRPIGEIEPPELLAVLRKVQARDHLETVARMRALASRVFRFGIASGYCLRARRGISSQPESGGAMRSMERRCRCGVRWSCRRGVLSAHIESQRPTVCPREVLLCVISVCMRSKAVPRRLPTSW
jgi:hypothetical protein